MLAFNHSNYLNTGNQQCAPKLSLKAVIQKVTDMSGHNHPAQQLAEDAGLKVNKVSWEDCARSKGSCWGPCISDMTLRVNGSCMPVIRQPNFTDKTWDIKMKDIPIVVGNESSNEQERLQTISLSDYLCHFSDFMTNDVYRGNGKKGINLLSSKENGDSHVIVSSQACFLPIIKGEETKFNVSIYNYQSQPRNPAVLVIVSTSKGASAQIIEGREQYLLFNHNGKNADFVGERVSDVRRKKGQKNIHDKKLSKQEKQGNVIVIVQIPLKKRIIIKPPPSTYNYESESSDECDSDSDSEYETSEGSDSEECDESESSDGDNYHRNRRRMAKPNV